jgi:hypothetical protein
VTASAVLRVGCHAPVVLHGAPVAVTECRPGEVTISLGHEAVITITTLEWTDDLLAAAADAGAIGFTRAGMRRTLPAAEAATA